MGLTRKRAKADPPPEFRPCRFEWGGYSEELLRELLGDEEKKQVIDNTPVANPPKAGERNWKINNRLSGEWLITGINYTFDNGKGNVQEITLVKRELGTQYLKK